MFLIECRFCIASVAPINILYTYCFLLFRSRLFSLAEPFNRYARALPFLHTLSDSQFKTYFTYSVSFYLILLWLFLLFVFFLVVFVRRAFELLFLLILYSLHAKLCAFLMFSFSKFLSAIDVDR